MRTPIFSRFGSPRVARALLLVAATGACLVAAPDARAQNAGTVSAPLPNVMLLVDTSGSMERMSDNSLPSANRNPAAGTTNVCSPGNPSNPNRWGMLLQALTGNLQPYFSCAPIDRTTTQFKQEFQINHINPYDTSYFLPYHRPLTGNAAVGAGACAIAPIGLPGATLGQGVGPLGAAVASTNAEDFPASGVFTNVGYSYLSTQYAASSALASPIPAANQCLFDQAADGQLDASLDFIRFGMMTFDNDPASGIGVTTQNPYGGSVLSASPFGGEWSYWRSPGNPLLVGSGNVTGRPLGCPTDQDYELGGRNWAAPPWEGRMIQFPNPVGTLLDIERTNQQIQTVLLGSRPYGATPIDAMLDDARDYLWYNAQGPWGTTTGHKDPYVQGGCRAEYIILLTDGAPNMNMRPGCQGGGICPYPDTADQAASKLFNGPTVASRDSVTTFVIGFSVNGSGDFAAVNDGFPSGINSCKDWYAQAAPNGGASDPIQMDSACSVRAAAGKVPVGSTADACCTLNKIALYGSGGPTPGPGVTPQGPFFAESQVDLVLAFSRVLAKVTKSATTRTTPGYSPVATTSSGPTTATFVASFIPDARKPWSGEIARDRSICVGTTPTPQAPAQNQGDSYAVDLAAQANAANRFFITAVGTQTGTRAAPSTSRPTVDSSRTMRPYDTAPADGIPAYSGQEVAGIDNTLLSSANFDGALNIDDFTCKRSKAVKPGNPPTSVLVPSLAYADCTEVIWDFTTAYHGSVLKGTPQYDFNVRCTGAAADQGTCSITPSSCQISSPTACTVPGEVCVPQCSALGAIFRSSPAIVGAPQGFLRDEGFRLFQQGLGTRRTSMFVATTDGVLHAFKAVPDLTDPAGIPTNYEMWAFVPPAALPKLAANYPGGQQLVLDGSPVVKDVVWDRTGGAGGSVVSTQNKNDWHSTLVAGLGSSGGGYYALNVSDVDCGGTGNAQLCSKAGAWNQPSAGNLSHVSFGADNSNGSKPGPHFLWQITDVEKGIGLENAKLTRTSIGDNKSFVALFGRQTGTPAITTIQVTQGGTEHAIGVAVLPGGIDGPPVTTGAGSHHCLRSVKAGGYGGGAFTASSDLSDPSYLSRSYVRQWGAAGCSDAVPGRGLTLVRLDTGEIIRHFGRKTMDVPSRLTSVTTDSPFDSPVIGTPVVYPATVGATAQKIYVGDADGTIWRLDVSQPCDLANMNACTWEVDLFQDMAASGIVTADATNATESQPVTIPPILSQSPSGSIVVNAATGDQENIVTSAEKNFVISVEEVRPTVGKPKGIASVRWVQTLLNAERVTGPMVVFDRSLYFSTYLPQPSSDVCNGAAKAFLWGLDYYNPRTVGSPLLGGDNRWCPSASIGAGGTCTTALQPNEDVTASVKLPTGEVPIIPGVTIRATQSCTQSGALTEDFGTGITGVTPTQYELFSGVSTPKTSSLNTATAATLRVTRPTPRISTSVDAWAFVTD